MGAEYLQLHSSCSHVAVPHHRLCAMGVVSRDVVCALLLWSLAQFIFLHPLFYPVEKESDHNCLH